MFRLNLRFSRICLSELLNAGHQLFLKVDDSGEVPLILQDNERLQMIMGEEDELPLALPIHVIPTNDFLI